MLRKQFDEQSKIIDQRMAEELRQAELDYAGPEQKSAKRVIRNDRIRSEYAAGASVTDLSRKYHLSEKSIRRILQNP